MIKLFRYLKSYWLMILVSIVFIFVQTMCDLKLPQLMADIVDKGIMVNDIKAIYTSGGIMLLYTFISVGSAILVAYFMSKAASGFGRDVRSAVFSKVLYYSNDEFNKIGTASLITRSTNDINQVQQLVVMSRMMIGAPIMAVGGIIMAVTQARSLTWILVLVISVICLLILIAMFSVMPLFKSLQKKVDKLNLVLREALTGIRVVRAFNRTSVEEKKFDEANKDLTSTYLKINKIMAVLMPIMMFIMSSTSLLVIYVSGYRIEDGSLEIGGMIAFMQYVMLVMFSVIMMTMVLIMVPRAQVSSVRINEVLQSETEIFDPASPKKPDESRYGEIEFRDVTFRFKGAENPVLKNISFVSRPGETTAIIGGTGAGKTTLVELIPRFYDIESGSILVGGVDIKQMTQADLRSRISLVTQKAVIFGGTIEENITFGNSDSSESGIKHAAEIAQASEFINEKEDKFQTEIAQGGTDISGGQKQRLSIARALLRKPEIYIFDDSFSALDFKTDAKLRSALKGEVKNATTIIVAQRVGTILDADRILVINDGELVAQGKHDELFEKSDVYREIVLSQLSEEELA